MENNQNNQTDQMQVTYGDLVLNEMAAQNAELLKRVAMLTVEKRMLVQSNIQLQQELAEEKEERAVMGENRKFQDVGCE